MSWIDVDKRIKACAFHTGELVATIERSEKACECSIVYEWENEAGKTMSMRVAECSIDDMRDAMRWADSFIEALSPEMAEAIDDYARA